MLHRAKIISWPFVCNLHYNKRTISLVNTYDGNIGFDVAFSIAKYRIERNYGYDRMTLRA